MKIIEIKDKDRWNKFVAENGSQFLQSAEWQEFQESLGRKTWLLEAMSDKNEILAGALVVKYGLPLGRSYLYLPRGPVAGREWLMSNGQLLIGKIREIAENEKAIFIRAEPMVEGKKICPILEEIKPVQPKDEWWLDLGLSEVELLKAMHPKTRYNIGLAWRHEVKIKEGKEKDFENSWQLIASTYKNKGLRTHPRDYYFKMLKLESAKLYLAEYKGKILAANLMVFWEKQAIYLHGGSSEENKNVMASYLLFWETIREAKKRGYKYYNFGGIASKGDVEHPWFGITRFKKGFGGFEVNYPGTWDLPLNKFWYKLYTYGKKII
jgi:lipid II:glycine glycyltransferase (peptidoglycan interpeptide bridge formation enzyme)